MHVKRKIEPNKLEFMSHDFYKKFAANNITDVTILACKFEGHLYDSETYSLNQVATLKELPGILVETESWSEGDIIKEIDASYQCIRKYMLETEKFEMPSKLNYTVKYLDLKEWTDLFNIK